MNKSQVRNLFVVMLAVGLMLALFTSWFVNALAAASAPTEVNGAIEQETEPVTDWESLPPEIRAKVDPRILAEFQGQVLPAHLGGTDASQTDTLAPLEYTRFIVYLIDQPELELIPLQSFDTVEERKTAVFQTLVNTAQATQGPVRSILDTRVSQGDAVAYQPFYIFNGFAVEGNLETLIEIAQRDDVERIVANYPLVPLWETADTAATTATSSANDLGGLDPDNFNIDLVDAERVWNELGVTGEGAVVANIDTGVEYTHPALVNAYRGNLGGGFDHNYNWFDPDPNLYPNGDLGPSQTNAPFDTGDHGTHTMGTMVGDGGTADTKIGMAPGAKWIAISLNELIVDGDFYGDDIRAHKAFQWMICPTDLTGDLATADCSKAPNVVNNSWGSSHPAGESLRPDIQALRAAGIVPVFAAGNPSAGEGSIGSPGSAPEAVTVGATDIDDNVASFSGRGPSFYEGEQKPELSAPGVDVKSSVDGGTYANFSGTSMAAPHVAGLVALMVSADLQNSEMGFDVDELERFMTHTAVDLGDPGPDNDFGYGRINAYDAVRWVISAGDLSGAVTDAGTTAPLAGATLTGVNTGTGDAFQTTTGASGQYSTTVPAGTYNVTVTAWGYNDQAFNGQIVITGVMSLADFALTSLPTATLTGQVLDDLTPVSGALVYVAANPAVNTTTDASGAYTLTLPVDDHDLVVEATGYRIEKAMVTVPGGGSSQDFAMTPAPTILLVNAEQWRGYFFARRVDGFFRRAMDQHNYLYDEWEIQDTSFNDVQMPVTGTVVYGVPSTTTLRTYDLVIWTHTGSSPDNTNADDELIDYLNSGGRLIISGQDIGFNDRFDAYYEDYLHADYLVDSAAAEGETVSGVDFLDAYTLEITNANLYGYPNDGIGYFPDGVAALDGEAFPVLNYDNGNGAAALAVDSCSAPYRAVYFAIGYETIGPRGDNPDPASAAIIDESITWVMDDKDDYAVTANAAPPNHIDEPGTTVVYDLSIRNGGALTATFDLTLTGNSWPTRILSGTTEVSQTAVLAPCQVQNLTVEVDIPATANTGDKDTSLVTAALQGAGTPSASVELTTTAFPTWQVEPDAPYAGSRVSLAAWENSIYLAGGDASGITDQHYEFNACTNEWIARAPIPTVTGNHAAATLDGKMYVPGGTGDAGAVANLYIYDIATDTWSAGAPMPEERWANATVALNGEIYVIGGLDFDSVEQATTFVYNPDTDSWRTVAPMSEARFWVAGAALNGKLYVVGGSGELNTVEEYDPATDTWTTKASMLSGRAAPGAASHDGYLYVAGGGFSTYLTSAERYNPATDTWEPISSLNTGRRTLGVAFAAGRLFAANGWDGTYRDDLESLLLADSFCFSDKSVAQASVQPGERISYTINLHADTVDRTVTLVDPIPAGTTFAGFGSNPIGATYNAVDDQVEWNGLISGGSAPVSITFGVDVAASGWQNGDLITNVATFDNGDGLSFDKSAVTTLSFPDLSPSTKTVDAAVASSGDTLVYTIRVENSTTISDTAFMSDPIPANTTYVTGSVTATLGTATYDALQNTIFWSGTLPSGSTHQNASGDYEYGDNIGGGDVPNVTFDWIEIAGTGTPLNLGNNTGAVIPVGFDFTFYGNVYPDIGVASNGYLTFEPNYDTLPDLTDSGEDCPLVNTFDPNDTIAAFWDNLNATNGNVYYQLFGSAPNRYLVVQWDEVTVVNTGDPATFEAILYEGSNVIKLQYETVETGLSHVIGIENMDASNGITYNACGADVVYDGRAIVFVPDGENWPPLPLSSDITFAVTTDTSLPSNTEIVNTATISGQFGVHERSATTLIDPVDLSSSVKTADHAEATIGDVVTYDFNLTNTGLLTATGAMLTDTVPSEMSYVAGSVACGSGSCAHNAGVITWSGDIAPGETTTLTFAATLTAALPDSTPVTNVATLNNGLGEVVELQATFLSRASDLSASFKQATPDLVEAGGTVSYAVNLFNSGGAATNATMQDVLPPEVTYVDGSLVCGTGSCSHAGGVITWNGVIPANSLVSIQFQATAAADLAHGTVVTNTAVITNINTGDTHQAAAAVTVVKPADLMITKDGPETTDGRTVLIYTITYENLGPFGTDEDVQIVDTLPDNVLFMGSNPRGAYDPVARTITWDVGALAAGDGGTLVVRVRPGRNVASGTVLTNTVSISTIGQDLNPDNNHDEVNTTVESSGGGGRANVINNTAIAGIRRQTFRL